MLMRAAELDPTNGGVRNNIGNVHVERGEIDLAAEAYEEAIRIDEKLADPYNNLASIWRNRGDNAKAEALLRRALALNSGNGLRLSQSRRPPHDVGSPAGGDRLLLEGAGDTADQSLTTPMLALTYWHAGMKEKALQLIRKWAREAPDDPQAQHLRASFTGENVPARASDAYVSMIFDKFAGTFDAHLDNLQYRAPELVAKQSPRQYLPAGAGSTSSTQAAGQENAPSI